MANYKTVYPYIPNSEPNIKAQMLKEVNANNVDELYSDIPAQLRFNGVMNFLLHSNPSMNSAVI